LASVGGRNPINIFIFETGSLVYSLPTSWFANVCFSLDNKLIISHARGAWSRDTVTLWDINNGKKLREIIIPNDNEM